MPRKKISFKHANFKESLKSSLRGLYFAINNERNARRIFACAILILLAAGILKTTPLEYAIIILIISLVFVAEIFNTLVEHLIDLFRRKYDTRVKILKDLSSAAVIVASIGAATIGIIILGPKLINYIYSLCR